MSKEYFSHDIGTLNNTKIIKMMNEYGHTGLGYYWSIVEEIYRADGQFDMTDIAVMSKNTGIEENTLTTFISECVGKFTEKGVGLFTLQDNLLSSNSIKKRIELRKKRAAARTQSEITERIEIEGIESVNLAEEQYDKLIEKYGEEVANKSIQILDEWLSKKGKTAKSYIGKNHYAHFRADSWVVQRAKEVLGKDKKTNWSV